MAKIHLQRNKAENGQAPVAVCATNPYRTMTKTARLPRNSRNTYQFMASEIVKLDAFKQVPEADRCAHCMDMGLKLRNTLRREKGLPPVAHLFD